MPYRQLLSQRHGIPAWVPFAALIVLTFLNAAKPLFR